MISKIVNYAKKMDSTKKSGFLNMIIKPFGFLITFFTTPLLLKYFDNEKYGIWATLLTIITWVNYFDVGLGNGLRNTLSKEISEKDNLSANKSISTAYIILSLIGLLIYIILIASIFLIDWNLLLNTNVEINKTLLIFFTFICLNFVLSVSNNILYALQKSTIVSIKAYLGQLFNVIGLLVLNELCPGNLEALALLFGTSTMITHIITFIIVKHKHKYLKFNLKSFEIKKIKEISSVGLKFFVIQICCLVLFTTDNLLISHYFGSGAVTPFSITDKLFSTAYSFLAAFLVPYWSKSTVAFAQNDINWLKKSIRFSAKMCAVFIIGYFLLLFCFNPIISIWIGNKIEFSVSLTITMCLYYCVYSILTLECQFINGSGKIRTQMIIYIIIAILNIPLSIFLGVTLKMGVTGIRLTTLILLIFATIVLGKNLMNIIKRVKQNI